MACPPHELISMPVASQYKDVQVAVHYELNEPVNEDPHAKLKAYCMAFCVQI